MSPCFPGILLLAAPVPAPQEPGPSAPVAEVQAALAEALAGDDATALHALGNAAFQRAVSPSALAAGLERIRTACGAPPLPLVLDPPGWPRYGFAHVLVGRGPEREAVFRLNLDAEGRIAGLRSRLAAVPRSLAELLAEVRAWPGEVGLAAARVAADGTVRGRLVLHRGGPLFPLASLAKVYVLAELARQEAAGAVSDEEELALREEWKSLPSGRLQAEAAGSRWRVGELARRMIRESDNTAADHLLHRLGRARVEAVLAPAGNSDPARNQPWLTTWEMFQLKALPEAAGPWGGDLDALAAAWAGARVAGRRRLLTAALAALDPDEEPARRRARALLGYQVRTLASPGHRAIEWFAAPEDLTGLFLAAWRGRLLSPAASARFRKGLRASLPFYEGPGVRWQGFKGGSETGILTFGLLVELTDGGAVAVCVCRAGFPPLDPGVGDTTREFTGSLLRAAAADRLPLQAAGVVLRP